MPPEHTQRELRGEIRWLGEVLGEVLREQEGDSAFDLVEEVRALARARRRGEEGAEQRMVDRLGGLSEEEMEPLIAALSVFFDLANLAEDRQRVRVVRERERSTDSSAEGSVAAAVRSLHESGVDADRMEVVLQRTGIEFVFTAHPTEAKRRSVREKVRDLRSHLYTLDRPDLLPRERARLEREVKADLTGLWQTQFVRFRRPTVLEELDRSLFFAGNLWSVVPGLFREVRDALAREYPGRVFELPGLVRFATWIGGDRDGNPNVTAVTTRRALERLRGEALERHIEQARVARRSLSMSSEKAGVNGALTTAIEEALRHWPALEDELEHLAATEPYRRWLRIVQWRLERAAEADILEPAPNGAYATPAELVADLRLARRSLAENGGVLLADAHLDDWICQADVFGFSLMRLDIRQESTAYHEALAELLPHLGVHDEYAGLDEAGRQALLAEEPPAPANGSPLDTSGLSEETRETVQLFRLLAAVCRAGGPSALGAHVISMTHRPSDVLAVLWLSRWAASEAGLPDERLPIPIAPLFETIDDLRGAAGTLDDLFGNPTYRAHLRALDDRQLVMVGYSDSTKDGGYLAASWGLYEAQFRMQEPAERHGVDLVFFHGRGGALGRGGGPAARHIRSLPARTLRCGLRITEQGEVLAERYDDPRIARRHLEQMLSALLEWGGGAREREPEAAPAHPPVPVDLLERLSVRSREAYRDLVDHPGFIPYFEEATPIHGIEELPIGSRPSRRRAERSLATLRAIPWVFSWTQSRHLIPAWYGLGSALEEVRGEPDAKEALRELYRKGGFFTATLDNAALALAKADMGIARLHGELVEDADARREIGERIAAEYERTRAAVLAIIGQDELLDDIPWLKRSIAVRNPYVDPLNLLQVELFRRLRGAGDAGEDSPERARLRELVRLTIQGIAGGLRTTG